MSTRCTIAYSDNFHLYEECFDKDNVYLCLDSGDWSASLETAAIDWRDGESARPSLHLKMDVTLWRHIVESWASSQWGQRPEDDHKRVELNFEAFESWIGSPTANKASSAEEDKKEDQR